MACKQKTIAVHPKMATTPKALNKAPSVKLDKSAKTVELRLSKARSNQPCHISFEPYARPLATWPFTSEDDAAFSLFQCKREAFEVFDDGTFAVAYALPAAAESGMALDMRTLVFDKAGKLLWTHRMTRKEQGVNFVSNFRESFILDMPPHLICSGTLWEGSVQMHCMDRKNGQPKWMGKLPFWSGITPQAMGMSVYIADLTALRKHYPYNGLERRYKRLDGPGGRLSVYATDGQKLFFAANRTGYPLLTAYDFKTMKRVWQVEIDREFESMYTHVFKDANLLLLNSQKTLFAIDTRNGKLLYTLDIQEDNPPITYLKGNLYMLQRLPEAQNRLVAIDPKSGQAKWSSTVPNGTLRLGRQHQRLFIGSPSSAQRVYLPESTP